MSDFDPDSEDLFAKTRDAFNPRPEDEARIHRALTVKLTVSPAPQKSTLAPRWKAGLVAIAAVVVGAGAFAYEHRHPSPSPVPREVPAQQAAIEPAPSVSDAPPVLSKPPAVMNEAPPQRAPRAARSTGPSVAAAPSTFAEEVALIGRMQDLWRSRDLGALAGAIADHEKRFPHGVLSEEREAMKTMLSCERAHSAGAASELAAAFAARHPASPHTSRVASACSRPSER
jgi:hypothetical protein